ncbi:MAG: response regulator [Phycisphaerales bacterium]
MASDRITVDPEALAALSQIFDVQSDGADPDAAPGVASPGASPTTSLHLIGATGGRSPLEILEAAAEGAGFWQANTEHQDDLDGLVWTSDRLRRRPADVQRLLARTCRMAAEQIELEGTVRSNTPRPSRKFAFAADDGHFEVVISPVGGEDGGSIDGVVAVLWETTASQRVQSRIDAIDRAGAELLRIETEAISRMNVRERLQRLSEKIVAALHEILSFDTFEIRLIDRETRHLELVINEGMRPMEIGETMSVGETDNGISGFVAATGRSYLCPKTGEDLRYRSGRDDAQSSLTVPLRLHDDSVIGVLNVESDRPQAFDDEDLRFAELFGRYVAMSMHILDLLVVERYTTNEQLALNVSEQLTGPLDKIAARAEAILERAGEGDTHDDVVALMKSVESIREDLRRGVTGPRTLIGADSAVDESDPDPVLAGKRILLADNEAVVRDAIHDLLVRAGCDVVSCDGGAPTIERIESMGDSGEHFDLVISDIRMPDRNGYEVFRAVRERTNELPVLLMTGFGYDPHHSIVRASEEGLDGFLFKPLKAAELLETVRTTILNRASGNAAP